MKHNALKIIYSICLLSGYLSAQFTPVNLSHWEQRGNPAYGTWTVSADSSSVRQSENDPPTFFVSPDTFSSATFNGAFFVDSGDDDYIGFVFGFRSPDTINNYFDFYLFDWKGVSQAGSLEGFTLSRVEGTVNVTSGTNTSYPYWDHMDSTQTILDTQYGDYGWIANREYTFQLNLEPTRVRITIDTTLIFDVSGQFQEGRFGFYNYSQPGVNYQRFYVNDAPVAVDDHITTAEDQPLNIMPTNNDTDSDNHALEITYAGTAMHGNVNIIQGDSIIFYSPNENYYGPDSFAYNISDNNGGIDSAMVYINVVPRNDAPYVTETIPDRRMDEDQALIFHAALNDYFADIDINDAFIETFNISSSGNVTGTLSADSLFLSTNNFIGFDTLTITAVDDSGATAASVFTVEVLNQNNAPFLSQNIADTVIARDSQNIFYVKLNNYFSDEDDNDSVLDSFSVYSAGNVVGSVASDSLFLSSSNFTGFDSLTVTAVDDSGSSVSTGFVVEVRDVSRLENMINPLQFSLKQNYPNPFNPFTVINYQLATTSNVTLKIYDVTGREVKTLLNKRQAAGEYSITINASDMPSGIYFYKLVAGKFTQTRKMILLK